MTLLEAIQARHSVRSYKNEALSDDIVNALNEKISDCNILGDLHIQLVTGDPKAFKGMLSYGTFKGVENYIAMVGRKCDDLDEKIGYYGELLVLYAQTLGLNTCWVGLTYKKTKSYEVAKGEKLVCVIAIGYGETSGTSHKIKTVEDVSNAGDNTPKWFNEGVKAALLAPTAINQQKFHFTYIQPHADRTSKVRAEKGFSLMGYTKIDLGIAKLHFELGAGKNNFEWSDKK